MLGHRQAFSWIDEWINMTYDDVRAYEAKLQHETNIILKQKDPTPDSTDSLGLNDDLQVSSVTSASISPSTPEQSTSPVKKGYFASWWS